MSDILIRGMEMPKDIEPGLVIEFADGIDGKRYARLWHYQHGGLTEWVEAISAVDVRPVVLCKDCAYSRKGKESLECEKHRYAWNNLNRWVNDDDFCNWGVKREEDDGT